MPRHRSTIEDLRRVIDCLPTQTREAMLTGIRSNEIIVGAYSDRDGGVCPMLAAHRCGGRTSFISFARAWDAFTGVKRARRATERELAVLERHLVASLAVEDRRTAEGTGHVDLGGAIAAHQAASRDRRSREAAASGGWGFLKERRERQDAERALERARAPLGTAGLAPARGPSAEGSGEQAFEDRRERELV